MNDDYGVTNANNQYSELLGPDKSDEAERLIDEIVQKAINVERIFRALEREAGREQ